jgi:hypothetical protein
VLHQTVLRKKESMKKPLQSVFDQVNGEISRHLGGRNSLTRWRTMTLSSSTIHFFLLESGYGTGFSTLVDTGGMSTQLRTQLRLAYEGSRSTALEPIGSVIPADFIFNQLSTYLIRKGCLRMRSTR